MRISLRFLGMCFGIAGAVVAFVVNALYSFFHMLGRVSGITADQSHLFIGSGLAIVAAIGAVMALGLPELGALLMAVVAVAFFWIIGWWAILPLPLLLAGAVLAFQGRRERQRATA